MTGQLIAAQRPSLWSRVLDTSPDAAPTVARVMLALVMFPHGAQKLFGWFGGYGWEGTMGFMTGQIGLPTPLAAGLILLESVGSVLLLLGLLTRPIALGFIGIMLGAIFSVHAQFGFFMNWSGAQAGEGFEYHLLVIALSIVLVLRGGGRWALDRRLAP
ncbi:MAG: DoxX family protein [Planctomycetes bacterium]|nr:DoxX family protein [Planctomycetota bacterium]